MIRFVPRRCALAVAVGGLSLALIPGCGGGSTRAYTSTAASARESLDAALQTWQKGGKPDELGTASPAVHVVDSQWTKGQVLEGYEIIEEKPGQAETEKRFAVTLKLKKPAGETKTEYILIGRNPIWVFRDVDYVKTGEMGEDPKPKSKARRR